MNKYIGITVGGVILVVLTALLMKDNSSDIITKKISADYSVTLKRISSKNYYEMMNDVESDSEDYEGFYYFLLRLNETSERQSNLFKELNSLELIGEKVNYLSNKISEDLVLITESDTLKCAMSHWERTYNVRKDLTVSVAFEKTNNKKPKKFIWNDNLISGIPLKFNLRD